MAPAYDLTYSTGKGKTNTHSMTLNGKNSNFTINDLYETAKKFGINKDKIHCILKDTIKVRKKLPDMLQGYNIPDKRIAEIITELNEIHIT